MTSWPTRMLVRWVDLVVMNPLRVLLAVALVTIAAGWISVDRYAMNSRLGDLVQQSADWRDNYEDFQAAFPQLVETALVVVSGESFKQVETVSLALESRIKAHTDTFVDVYAPANDSFFRDNALLFMSVDRLDDVSDALAEAQPMLTAVARDPSLRSVLALVAEAVRDTPPAGFDRVVDNLVSSADAARRGADPRVLWSDQFFPAESDIEGNPALHYRIIFLRGVQNYGAALPNAEVIARLQSLIGEVQTPRTVTVAVTGEIALRHEEVQAATGGVKIAGTLALLLLGAVLALGVRSGRIVAATFVLLLTGVVWTSAWAMLSVGSYNTLSLVFLVMFFGLGVDFCVHYCLRLQEALVASGSTREAFGVATESVGGAVVLCTVTTAIGFLGFLPTPYKGLADLGVISAGGMVVACVLTFTLLPALFTRFGLPVGRELSLAGGEGVVGWLLKFRGGVLALGAVLVALCVVTLPNMQFDYSVLALRDPDSQSMRTLRELQREKQVTDYALYAALPESQATAMQQVAELASVEQTIGPGDYVPAEQDTKLFALEDLQELLGSALQVEAAHREGATAPTDAPSIAELRAAIAATLAVLAAPSGETTQTDESPLRFAALRSELTQMQVASDATLLAWQEGVVSDLVTELSWLRRAVSAAEIEFADLPEELRARLVAADGRQLHAILPAEDITPVAALSRFIDTVRAELPVATGRPVVEWGVGNIVVASFKTALMVALGGISLVLLVVLRSVRDTVLVLAPLVLAALFTTATSVLFAVPINMASVLVLPLVFGLGVDNGIHMVERYHSSTENVQAFMHSSTPRAVLLSTLTTIGTFAALMLSPHAGTASIGFLLTIAVGYLLLFTVFLLPVLLSLFARQRS